MPKGKLESEHSLLNFLKFLIKEYKNSEQNELCRTRDTGENLILKLIELFLLI